MPQPRPSAPAPRWRRQMPQARLCPRASAHAAPGTRAHPPPHCPSGSHSSFTSKPRHRSLTAPPTPTRAACPHHGSRHPRACSLTPFAAAMWTHLCPDVTEGAQTHRRAGCRPRKVCGPRRRLAPEAAWPGAESCWKTPGRSCFCWEETGNSSLCISDLVKAQIQKPQTEGGENETPRHGPAGRGQLREASAVRRPVEVRSPPDTSRYVPGHPSAFSVSQAFLKTAPVVILRDVLICKPRILRANIQGVS